MGYNYNIAIDLEFTPVHLSGGAAGLGCEIIELGAVRLDSKGNEIDAFSEVVKPMYAKGITRRVSRITGIRDADLARARHLESVMQSFAEWMGPNNGNRILTWGGSDRHQIQTECNAKGIDVPLPSRWLDLQRIYPRLMCTSRNRRVSLGEAADWCGLSFVNRHRALDDARATGQIFRMAAAGECQTQRHILDGGVKNGEDVGGCSASIGSGRNGNRLAELLASLSRQEAMAC